MDVNGLGLGQNMVHLDQDLFSIGWICIWIEMDPVCWDPELASTERIKIRF